MQTYSLPKSTTRIFLLLIRGEISNFLGFLAGNIFKEFTRYEGVDFIVT